MGNEVTQNQRLHTAEHIFARCLQNQGVELKVRKVDTNRSDRVGEAFFASVIPLEKLLNAEQSTNKAISEGMMISTEEFESVEKARESFPKLRFNADMLGDVKGIRVVKIGDFDSAACAQEHVNNTKEIVAFAISSVTYPSGETKMMFRAGADALDYSLRVKGRVLGVASADNFEAEHIGERYGTMKASFHELSEDTGRIIDAMLGSLVKPVLYVRAANLNLFYKHAGDYVRKNPESYFVVFNDKQLFGLKGASCTAEMEKMGNELKESGAFAGAVKPDSVSGKVLDLKKVQDYFGRL